MASVSGLLHVTGDGSDQRIGWHVDGQLNDPQWRHQLDGLIVADARGRIFGMGEFSFTTLPARCQRIHRVAEGFDVYIRADAGCTDLTLYGADAEARRPVALVKLLPCKTLVQ